MVELRRIYRTQYLQKLALVTNEERLKQIEYMQRLYRGNSSREFNVTPATSCLQLGEIVN